MKTAYEYAEGLKLNITVDGKSRKLAFPKSDQFAPELLYFSDCILNDREPEPSGREGLADVRVIRSLYESMARGKPVRIEAEGPEKRPTAEQEIRRPPLAQPRIINAQSSHTD
ncbi:MAG: hypothetical protein WBC04_00060 [Candidatus Acidiferrales bacterium]